jgi:hypothetical protein
LWVHEDYAYASALTGGLNVFDISDPSNPEHVANVDVDSRDVNVFETGGHRLAVTAAGWNDIHVVDVTDPENPSLVETVDLGTITHNVVVVPDENVAYNSRSGPAGIDIIDLSDPTDPEFVKVWDDWEITCHDIEVRAEADRAYCAGLSETYLLDISDPLDPTVEHVVREDDIGLHHWAMVTPGGDTLVVGDEEFGEPDGCDREAHSADEIDVHDDSGALWFYDMTATGPVTKGTVSVGDTDGGWCTAHFGDVVGNESLLAVGWYTAGVVFVDWGDPGAPELVDQWIVDGANVWDVRYHDDHLFTGDLNRGMDVIDVQTARLAGPGPLAG